MKTITTAPRSHPIAAAPAAARPALARRHELPAVKASVRRTLATVGFVLLASAGTGLRGNPAAASPASAPPLVERGRYLVENVGMCADCHTPRTDQGEFDRTRWLVGSALPFQPTVPMPWSPAAPPIAGLPTMTDAEAATFLQTGKRPNGTPPLPPMPEFRFNADDAQAIVAYLRALAK